MAAGPSIKTDNWRTGMNNWKKHSKYGIEVSESGIIKKNNKISKSTLRHDGYHVISVGGRGAPIRRVSRLVLETFIGECPKGMECRHLDGNSQNNNLNNLKWGTREEQIADQKKHGTFSPPPIFYGKDNLAFKFGKKIRRKVVSLIKQGYEHREVAAIVGMSKTSVTRINKQEIFQIGARGPR